MATAGGGRTDDDTLERIELHAERLEGRTTIGEIGQVRIATRVTEEPATVEVPVEAVAITTERRPADRPAPDHPGPYEEGDALVVPVLEERIEVRKVPWVVEEVVIRQVRTTETRAVTETIRREDIDVQAAGDIRLDQDEAPAD